MVKGLCSLADGRVREGICFPGEMSNPAPAVRWENRKKTERKLIFAGIFVIEAKPNFTKIPAFFSEKGRELLVNGFFFIWSDFRKKSFCKLKVTLEMKEGW